MLRVLVVDDDARVRDGLKVLLTANRYQVCTASDGAQAVAAFDSFQPELVVCDLVMGHVDGVSAIYNIRLRDPRVPILAITGSHLTGRADLVPAAERAGANRVLLKPFNPPALLDALSALMRAADRRVPV
jgi:DNA-binding response OmpR family regulator